MNPVVEFVERMRWEIIAAAIVKARAFSSSYSYQALNATLTTGTKSQNYLIEFYQ